MKVFFAVLITGAALVFAACGSSSKTEPTQSEQTAKVEYTCPMHPEVIQDKPGTCPKCGMELEKKE